MIEKRHDFEIWEQKVEEKWKKFEKDRLKHAEEIHKHAEIKQQEIVKVIEQNKK